MGDTKLHFVRRGTAIILAATLSTSMVPALALADVSDAGAQATASAAATTPTPDGFYLEAGKSYEVPVKFLKAGTTEDSMAGGFFDSNVKVSYTDGSYNVDITLTQYLNLVTDFQYEGNSLPSDEVDGTRVYHATLSFIKGTLGFKVAMPGGLQPVDVVIDTSSLPTEAPVVSVDKSALTDAIASAGKVEQGSKTDDAFKALQDAIAAAQKVADNADATQADVDGAVAALNEAVEAFNNSAEKPTTPAEQELALHVYFKGAENSRFAEQLGTNAKVTKTDDGYQVQLTVPSLGKGNQLNDITYQGEKVAKETAEDGSATYTFTVKDISQTLDITFGYTVQAGPMGLMTNLHPFQVVFEGATPDVSTVDKTGLTSEIVKAEKVEQGNKTDDAFAALQQAIADAYALADTHGATDAQVADGVAALKAAVDTFDASKDAVDFTALTDAIAAASKVEQGNKTDDAFKALQDAIAAAQKVADNADATQSDVDGAVAALSKAVEAFNNSADKPTTPETPGGYALEAGKEYTVPVALVKENGTDPSMAAQYFEKSGTVVYQDGSYQVTFSVTTDGQQYIKGISYDGIEDLGGGKYRVTVKSLDDLIPLTFNLQTPVGAMSQTGYLKLDTASLPKADGNQGGNQGGGNNGGQQGGNNNQNNNNNGNQGGNNGAQEQPGDTAQFQVGHTYQVPIAFMKQNSSEASMAAQYFYTTALVRPQQDGTFNVSFSATSEGLTHIIQLAHNGATLSNDNGTFTVNIPAATQDTVVPISMTIKEMQQLGGGPQTADMHLYLTQAKDLGTGQDGLTPAGTPGATAGNGAAAAKGSALAKTADGAPTAAVTGIAAMAAAAMAAAGTMLRRRFNK